MKFDGGCALLAFLTGIAAMLFLLCSCSSTEERDMRGVQKILMAKAGPNPVPIPKEIYASPDATAKR